MMGEKGGGTGEQLNNHDDMTTIWLMAVPRLKHEGESGEVLIS